MSTLESLAKNSDLKSRILFTLAVLAIYRLGVHVPTPGVDGNAVMGFFQAQSSGIFGLFNTFTGGALQQFSVFALGIMPYISASIIFQLLTTAVPYLENLKKEGEHGRKKITQYTRYATVVLAVIQAYAMSSWLMNSNHDGRPLVLATHIGFLPFQLMTIITLTAGTCFIMWLGEQITERGIGNGSSLIIFAGIVAGLIPGAIQLWRMIGSGEVAAFSALLLIVGMVIVIGAIIFLEVGQRRIPIQYSQKVPSGKQGMTQYSSHLPIKINFSGVMPPILASSLLMFPATVASFVENPWLKSIQEHLNPSGTLYNIAFVVLIVFFAFFYNEIVFNTKDVADNLKKHGGFIPGVRAGNATSEYIQKIIDRLTVAGATYLSVICIMPTILGAKMSLPFYFGGTSLLILVGVALDTSQQIQSHLLSQKYEGLLSKTKIRGRRVQY